MTQVTHHLSEDLLLAYAAGTLPHAFSVVVATHISLCKTCRDAYEDHLALAGVLLEDSAATDVSATLKSDVMALLDAPFIPTPTYERRGVYPAPVVAALDGRQVTWKRLGMGVRQDILHEDPDGSLRLLYIPPGQAVPDHGHSGLEMTLVLQGSFSDETGRFGVGDIELADEDLEHTPVADPGQPCICLAATDAPLRFRALVPRLLQSTFRI